MPRPRKARTVEFLPPFGAFVPADGVPGNLERIQLGVDELEAVRLSDGEGLDQTECAERMNVSRATFHRILGSAHHKISQALTQGRALCIEGGSYRLAGRHRCRRCGNVWRGSAEVCPACGSRDVIPAAEDRRRGRHRRRKGKGRGKRKFDRR